jgi:hypothetical protein
MPPEPLRGANCQRGQSLVDDAATDVALRKGCGSPDRDGRRVARLRSDRGRARRGRDRRPTDRVVRRILTTVLASTPNYIHKSKYAGPQDISITDIMSSKKLAVFASMLCHKGFRLMQRADNSGECVLVTHPTIFDPGPPDGVLDFAGKCMDLRGECGLGLDVQCGMWAPASKPSNKIGCGSGQDDSRVGTRPEFPFVVISGAND